MSSFLLQNCATHEVQQQQNNAANRTVGIAIRQESITPEMLSRYLPIVDEAIRKTYGSKTKVIHFDKGSVVEDPQNLYQIGKEEIDDLFVFLIAETAEESNSTVTIYNGSNLKVVTILKVAVPLQGEQPFTERYTTTFEKAALNGFSNPNLYPKSEPKHFANLLYVYSQQMEKNLKTPLTCETASEVLKFYGPARELYDSAQKRGTIKVVGAQGEAHLISTRSQESADKEEILKKCQEDASKTFELTWDFDTIDPMSHPMIRAAAQVADLEALLKQYTNKPSELRFKLEPNGELNLLVTMRFDPQRYAAWTKTRIPQRARNFNVLSLDPYFALLQRLVVFRASLPADAPPALRNSFAQMKMNLSLSTILNGQVILGVDGKFDPKNKSISMAYPNSVILSAPGFESKTIAGKDRDIFQEKVWMALGNCKTIDGTVTEDGLLIQFFGLPCN